MSFAGELMEATRASIKEEYKKAAENMEKLVHDQLLESNWQKAIKRFLWFFVTTKAGILRGPIQRYKNKSVWKNNKRVIQQKLVLDWESPHPLYVYPAPDSSDPNDSYIFEIHKYNYHDMYSIRDVPGALTENIDKAILAYKEKSKTAWEKWYEQDKRNLEEKQTIAEQDNELFDVKEFSGWIPGHFLKEYLFPVKEEDVTKPYYCNIYYIKDLVLYAHISDQQTHTRYYKACFESQPDAFWGQGIPDILDHLQESMNSLVRASIRNVSLASGPQVIINDSERIQRPKDFDMLKPWTIWVLSEPMDGTNSREPINFYQPSLIVNELLNFYNMLERSANTLVSVPSYPYEELKGAASSTSSGLSLAISQGKQGLKAILRNVDMNVIEPALRAICEVNNELYKNMDIKGDIYCKVTGSDSDFEQESNLARYTEFLSIIGNIPLALEIIGVEGFAKVINKIAEGYKIDLDLTLEDLQEVVAQQQARMAEEQAIARQSAIQSNQSPQQRTGANSSGGKPSKPKNLDSSGKKYGRADNTAQKREGGGAKKK